MFYNIKMGCVHGNGGKMYTLLYYMRAKGNGVDGIDGVNGKRGDGNRGARLFTGLGKKFFRTGEEKFPDREWKGCFKRRMELCIEHSSIRSKGDINQRMIVSFLIQKFTCLSVLYLNVHFTDQRRLYPLTIDGIESVGSRR